MATGGAFMVTLMACYGGARQNMVQNPSADDEDGDGHRSSMNGGADCNDSNPDVHPDAVDLPGDGIDQDCDGADAGAAPTEMPTETPTETPVEGDPGVAS